MSAPSLTRPMRSLLQGRRPASASRLAWSVLQTSAAQLRTNASLSGDVPPEAKPAAPNVTKPASFEEVKESSVVKKATESAPAAKPSPKKQPALQKELLPEEILARQDKLALRGEGAFWDQKTRMPRSWELFWLNPLKREAPYGVPSCDLQLRSYSLPNLQFFSDFALRAAYYLNLPASGPVPLPRMTEKWTVPRSHFIFKKSQENYSRTTLRRLIQIKDGHPEAVQIWLAFLQKHAYYGIGMKANVWEYCKLDVGKEMDEGVKELEQVMEEKWGEHMGHYKGLGGVNNIEEFMARQRMKMAGGR